MWGKYLVAISILYFGSVNVPKIAILALYHRLFPNTRIRVVIWIVLGTLICLTITTVITGLASCRPFSANWNPSLPGSSCIDKEAFFRYGSIPNILTDIVMLILPMRVVWNLHTSTRLKIGLVVTFATGSLYALYIYQDSRRTRLTLNTSGLITSIVRFTTFFRKNSFVDGTWAAVDLIMWTQLETGVYLISACIMTYRPLLERVGWGMFAKRLASRSKVSDDHTKNSKSARLQITNIAMKTRTEEDKCGFQRLGNEDGVDPSITVTTNISVSQQSKRAEQDLEF